jgi:hypothetical protein
MHRIVRTLLILAAAAFLAVPAKAQESAYRVYNEQLRVQLDQQTPESRDRTVDAGGWLSFAYFHYNDTVGHEDRSLRQFQIRPWGSVDLQGAHQFYVRGLLNWNDWSHPPAPIDQNSRFQGYVERAWYQFDLGKMIQSRGGEAPAANVIFKVGREYEEFGTGLALSMPMDLLEWRVILPNWEFKALLAKSIHDTDNPVDESSLVQDHQDRCFWGGQAMYTGLDRHRPFLYYFQQQDHTRPTFNDPFQSYDYSSQYVGAGSSGTVITPDLYYQTELVGETGETYSRNVTSGQSDICAWAYDGMLQYLFRSAMHPQVSAEYMTGSGDGDRLTSSSATVGGNQSGTKDNAFNGFGFRDTGVAFAPNLSNIHVYVAGASFFPLESVAWFKKMEVGAKTFFYNKANHDGPISDSALTNDDRWLGWEQDFYCDWRITSDLSWTIRYGIFQPGTAFVDRTSRNMLWTGFTLSF